MRQLLLLLLLSQCSHVAPLRWFSLVEPPAPLSPVARTTRRLALYPLPAVYLPGSACTLRNVEPRNIAMAREQAVFVASLLTGDRRRVAEVGAVLRIDDVRAATADSSGQVLAAPTSADALMVQCTVLGRVRLLKCDNLDAWVSRETYLLVDACEHDDDEAGTVEDELHDDVEDAIYQLVDALLLESDSADGAALDTTAAVAALEEAAAHGAAGRWWEALELWQRHCATRTFAQESQHRAERNELIVDCKLREGGVLRIPVQEHTLCDDDRRKLLDLDARAKDALAQLELDDVAMFQACLEARSVRERVLLLKAGVLREAERLSRRACAQRSLDS